MDREKVPRRKQACPADLSSIRSGRSNAAFFMHERPTFDSRLARIRSLPDHAHPRNCRVRRPVLGRAFLLTLFGRRPRCVQSVERLQLRSTARTVAYSSNINNRLFTLSDKDANAMKIPTIQPKTAPLNFTQYQTVFFCRCVTMSTTTSATSSRNDDESRIVALMLSRNFFSA